MSGTKRALFALILVVLLLTFIGITGASWPQSIAIESSPSPVSQATATVPLPTVRVAVVPTRERVVVPAPTATLARREYLGQPVAKVAPTTFLPGQGPQLPGELVYSGRRIDVYVGRNTFSPDQVLEMGIKAEKALSYMQHRFAVQLTRRVSVGVYGLGRAPMRGTRGIAYTDADIAQIFYQPGENQHKALVILAHELAHHLQATAYGAEAQRRADTVLLEGLATWITGEYWLSLSGASSWQARSRELIRAGYGGNLAAAGRSADSDVAYELWAGFVDYLASTYGWDKFNLLYVSGRGRAPGSADYQGIYGKTFSELAREWRATLQ